MPNVQLIIAETTRKGGEKVYLGKFPLTDTINLYLESPDRAEMIIAADSLITLISGGQNTLTGHEGIRLH